MTAYSDAGIGLMLLLESYFFCSVIFLKRGYFGKCILGHLMLAEFKEGWQAVTSPIHSVLEVTFSIGKTQIPHL